VHPYEGRGAKGLRRRSDDETRTTVPAIPGSTHQQDRRNVPAITALLQSAVWDLAYADELSPEDALRLYQAARLLLAASERALLAVIPEE
jgi:hypothetical protein